MANLRRGGVNKTRTCPSENKENLGGTSGQEAYKMENVSDDEDCFIVGVAQRSPVPECYTMQNCPKSEPMSPRRPRKRKLDVPAQVTPVTPSSQPAPSKATTLTTTTTTMSVPVAARINLMPFSALTVSTAQPSTITEVALPSKLFVLLFLFSIDLLFVL